jgi:hypothetical protein
LLPLIINIAKLLTEIVLILYIFGKPYDTEGAEVHAAMDNKGKVLRSFLEEFENTSLVEKFLVPKTNIQIQVPLLKKSSSHEYASQEFNTFLQKYRLRNFSKIYQIPLIF